MDWAHDGNGDPVQARGARHGTYIYICPRCQNDVFLASGPIRKAHFRHHSGNNDRECEEYTRAHSPFSSYPKPAHRPDIWNRWEVAQLPTHDSAGMAEPPQAPASATGPLDSGEILFAFDGHELAAYIKEPPSIIELPSFSSGGNTEAVRSMFERCGFLLGVYESQSLDDAFALSRWAEAGDRVMLLGPIRIVDRQVADLRGHFRRLEPSPRVEVRYGGRSPGRQPIHGLPEDWALCIASLPETFNPDGLEWFKAAPYALRGGWKWRRHVYWPDAPPTVVCGISTCQDGKWIAWRDQAEPVTIDEPFAMEVPAHIFRTTGHYRLWKEESRYSIQFAVQAPEWTPTAWTREIPASGGWWWGDGWPTVHPSIPEDDPLAPPRLYGPWPLGAFPEEPARDQADPPQNPKPPEWHFLRQCLGHHASPRKLKTGRLHALTRYLGNMHGK